VSNVTVSLGIVALAVAGASLKNHGAIIIVPGCIDFYRHGYVIARAFACPLVSVDIDTDNGVGKVGRTVEKVDS